MPMSGHAGFRLSSRVVGVGVRRDVGRATDFMLTVVVGEAAAVAQRGKGFGPVAVTSLWGIQSST